MTSHTSKGRVLVVDDDASARSGLETLLKSEGYAVELLDISVRTIQYRLHEYGMTSRDVRSGN